MKNFLHLFKKINSIVGFQVYINCYYSSLVHMIVYDRFAYLTVRLHGNPQVIFPVA
jgi:hypothetical protein